MENQEKSAQKLDIAVLGGGCFWCLEAAFNGTKGVYNVLSGYAGGEEVNPSYREVCGGATGHAEVVQIEFDPKIIAYEILLNLFFGLHDPTTLNRQGHDVGTQYRSVIFYLSEEQRATAEKVMQKLQEEKLYDDPFVTELKPLEKFYVAEDYHQRYFSKNPEQAYCQVVIMPKLLKFRQKFKEWVM